jgi:3-oxoacyl-[acyl-carrier protein] reductase
MGELEVALVTGGGYGLGAAIAQQLGSLGFAVAVVGRSESRLQQGAEELERTGVRALWRVCDASDWETVVEVVEWVKHEEGPIRVLVNNAGGWIGDTVENVDPTRFRDLVGASLLGTMHFSKAVIPHMAAIGGGFIINIGSTSGLPSTVDVAVASAPKAAVHSFSRTLAREVSGYNIRVSVIHPARVNKKLPVAEAEAADSEGRFRSLSPRQVAQVIAFIVGQPPNVAIREVVLTPLHVDF